MLLTEEEAKKLHCCRYPGGYIKCHASACMAWRWHGPVDEITLQSEKPEGEGWVREGQWAFKRPVPNRPGYCGLAGEP